MAVIQTHSAPAEQLVEYTSASANKDIMGVVRKINVLVSVRVCLILFKKRCSVMFCLLFFLSVFFFFFVLCLF